LEKILDNRIREQLEKTRGISENQFGFKKGKSTTDVLKRLMTIINQAEYNRAIGVITFDIKNAFNSANWWKILKTIASENIPLQITNVMDSYFKGRKTVYNQNIVKMEVLSNSGVIEVLRPGISFD